MGFDTTDAPVSAFDWPEFGLIDDVRPALAAARAAGEPIALATLVATEGGAPRGSGAQMVIGGDGPRAGFLSGGCIEADVAAHAAEVLADRAARRLVYGEGGPVDIALPCGSRIEIMVERIDADDAAVGELLRASAARIPARWTSDGGARLCVALPPQSLRDSSPKGGASHDRAALDPPPQGEVARRAGGGFGGQPFTRRYDPPTRLIVIGADPAAIAVARLAGKAGFLTTLIRPSGPEAAPDLRLVAYDRGEAGEALLAARPDAWTTICILTHDVAVEHAAVAAALSTPCAYIGVLGSRRRAPEREHWLLSQGFDAAAIARLHAPVGLPIGGKAPWEIAVSVIAEVMQTLHAKALEAE